VIVRADDIKIELSKDRLVSLLALQATTLAAAHSKSFLTMTAPARLKRVGREMKLVVEQTNAEVKLDMALLRIIAKAHDIQARLEADTDLNVQDIAEADGVTAAYIYALLRLRWLSPEITSKIVNGRQPAYLTAKRLKRIAARLPQKWIEQQALLGLR
jgi:hypothetical protein